MNPNTKNLDSWTISCLNAKGEPLEQNAEDDYERMMLKVRDPQSAILTMSIRTGNGREADEEFARNVLDALRGKSESDRLIEVAENAVQKHQQQQHRYFAGALTERVPQVLAFYEDIAHSHLAGVKHWRDDMIVYLRAMAMVAEMVGNASTHREKSARLRGLIEMLETTIQKLREEEFNFNRSWYRAPDVFRSDFPVRHYQERIRQLELQLEDRRGHKATPAEDSDESDPFADE